MRIASIEPVSLRIPLKPAFRMVSALGRHDASYYTLIRLRSDDGGEGVGEASVTPRWSGETARTVEAMVSEVLAPVLIGVDVTDVDEVLRRMDAVCRHNWFTKAAIEMACWDLWGRAVGKPAYELLGGPVRDLTLRSRFSLGAYDVETARRRAQELVDEGFDTIKVKVGGDPEKDMERVRAVREVIGPERSLVIDANGGWDADTAIRCVKGLADCHLDLVEQPTPVNDFTGMARVRRETGVLIMADDGCFDPQQAQELVRHGCCDVISVYPGKNGGIRRSQQIAEYAGAHGVACTIGSNLEWDVATAAMGHLAISTPNILLERYPGDIHGPVYHEQRIATNPLAISGPVTTMTSRPGLGIDVDWELVERLRRMS